MEGFPTPLVVGADACATSSVGSFFAPSTFRIGITMLVTGPRAEFRVLSVSWDLILNAGFFSVANEAADLGGAEVSEEEFAVPLFPEGALPCSFRTCRRALEEVYSRQNFRFTYAVNNFGKMK